MAMWGRGSTEHPLREEALPALPQSQIPNESAPPGKWEF